MSEQVSKSAFKARAFEFFREVERTGREVVVTDRGRPVWKVVPYSREPALEALRGSVLRYDDPTEPAGLQDWEGLR